MLRVLLRHDQGKFPRTCSTAINMAYEGNFPAIVDLLVENGAGVNDIARLARRETLLFITFLGQLTSKDNDFRRMVETQHSRWLDSIFKNIQMGISFSNLLSFEEPQYLHGR